MKMNHVHAAVNSEDGVSPPRPTQKFDVSLNESMLFCMDQVLAHLIWASECPRPAAGGVF
jgi:hypothetical protein